MAAHLHPHTATHTPQQAARNVHWDHLMDDISNSSFGSPLLHTQLSAQSLQYVNAQLIAHGFTHGAGLRLDGLGGKDQEVVLKCLVNMLAQRMTDMARAEELSSKYRTLAYDHERVLASQRSLQETTLSAQKDASVSAAKLVTAQKSLQSEEEAHRKTKEEYARLKQSMTFLRSTTANELKRKEKEVEKMAERMAKVANDQIKLGTVGAGLACSNLLEGSPMTTDNHYLDAALAQSESSRLHLLKENDALRDTILACANALQSVHHTALASLVDDTSPHRQPLPEPEMILSASLFGAPSVSDDGQQYTAQAAINAQAKLRSLFGKLRDAMPRLAGLRDSRRKSTSAAKLGVRREEDVQELELLRKTVAVYEAKLKDQQEARSHGQELLDRFVSDPRFANGPTSADASIELMSGPERDELAQALDVQKKTLAEERNRYTEATIKLGREKANLEAERIKFLEEKRAFQVKLMLADLPGTPAPDGKQISRAPSPNRATAMSRSPSEATRPPRPSSALGVDNAKVLRGKRSVSPVPPPPQTSRAGPSKPTANLNTRSARPVVSKPVSSRPPSGSSSSSAKPVLIPKKSSPPQSLPTRIQASLKIQDPYPRAQLRPPSPLPAILLEDLPEIPTAPGPVAPVPVAKLHRSTTPPLTEDDLMMAYERSPSPLLIVSPPMPDIDSNEDDHGFTGYDQEYQPTHLAAHDFDYDRNVDPAPTQHYEPAGPKPVPNVAKLPPVVERKPVPPLPSIPSHFKTPKAPGRGLTFPLAGAHGAAAMMAALAGGGGKRHLYSPAIPSPLSRIVRMADPDMDEDGPPSPSDGPRLAAVAEQSERREGDDVDPRAYARPSTPLQFLAIDKEGDDHEHEGYDERDARQQRPHEPQHEDEYSDDHNDDDEDHDDYGYDGQLEESLSPLSKIINMGASPALAPMISTGFEFPGLLSGLSLPTTKATTTTTTTTTTNSVTFGRPAVPPKGPVFKTTTTTTTTTKKAGTAPTKKKPVLGDGGEHANRGKTMRESSSSRGSSSGSGPESSGRRRLVPASRTGGRIRSSSSTSNLKPLTTKPSANLGVRPPSATGRRVVSVSDKENAGRTASRPSRTASSHPPSASSAAVAISRKVSSSNLGSVPVPAPTRPRSRGQTQPPPPSSFGSGTARKVSTSGGSTTSSGRPPSRTSSSGASRVIRRS